MIFVSHDLAPGRRVAHNITVMYAGQVIEQAPPKELLTNPNASTPAVFLGSVHVHRERFRSPTRCPRAVPGARAISPRAIIAGAPLEPSAYRRTPVRSSSACPAPSTSIPELPDEVLKGKWFDPSRGGDVDERDRRQRRRAGSSSLDDVHVTFRTRTGSILHPNLVHAVQGVTIKLMPGQTIGIVGESGCGKSTTANVMCGLQAPTSGKVYFKGKDVTKRTAEDRRHMGRVISVVFQNAATGLQPLHGRSRAAARSMRVHNRLPRPSREARQGTL